MTLVEAAPPRPTPPCTKDVVSSPCYPSRPTLSLYLFLLILLLPATIIESQENDPIPHHPTHPSVASPLVSSILDPYDRYDDPTALHILDGNGNPVSCSHALNLRTITCRHHLCPTCVFRNFCNEECGFTFTKSDATPLPHPPSRLLLQLYRVEGRLGNHLFQLAAARHLLPPTHSLCIDPSTASGSSIFDAFSPDLLPPPCPVIGPAGELTWSMVHVTDNFNSFPPTDAGASSYFLPPLDRAAISNAIADAGDAIITGYLCSYEYVRGEGEESLRRDFRAAFKPELVAAAESQLRAASKLPPLSPPPVTVGIHVRRGDILEGDWATIIRFPGAAYFSTAMDLLAAKHASVVFLVGSDDIPWCKSFAPFADSPHAVQFIDATLAFEMDEADLPLYAYDFAILAHCDHMITTVGTFSFWVGFLTGGDVVYYSRQFVEEHPSNVKRGGARASSVPDSWISVGGLSEKEEEVPLPPSPPSPGSLDSWRSSVFASFTNKYTLDTSLIAITASPSSDIKATATTASDNFEFWTITDDDHSAAISCAPGDRPCVADVIEVKLRDAVCGLYQFWAIDESTSSSGLAPSDEGYYVGLGLHGTDEDGAAETILALNSLALRGWHIPSPDPSGVPFADSASESARLSPRFLVLGDSHASAWSMLRHCSGVTDTHAASSVVIQHVCSRSGATMLGLSNTGSVSANAEGFPLWSTRAVFEKVLSRHAPYSDGGVILHLGEVDASHLIHARAARNGETASTGALLAASRFANFVAEVVQPHFLATAERPRIYVVPVVVNPHRSLSTYDGENNNFFRKEVRGEDQVAVARTINARLLEMASEQGWIVLSHPFAPGAGGDDADGSYIAPPRAVLGDDGVHFKLSLAWSWLNQGLKEAMGRHFESHPVSVEGD